MEDKQDVYERIDEENTKSNITDLIVFPSKFGEKSFEDLRELYYYDQNKYEDRKSYTNKKVLKFSIKDTRYKCNRTLNDSEILEFVKYITEKADDGDQFYCLMAGEIFIYSDDMQSIFGPYLIGPRLYDREKAIKYYKNAADLGSGVAYHILGDMLSAWGINAQLALDRYCELEHMFEIRYKGGVTSRISTVRHRDDGHKIKVDHNMLFSKFNDLDAERYVFDIWKLNDRFKVDFDTAKSCYELGAKLGNDICNKRLERFERKTRSVKRWIKKSMIDPLLDESTMSTDEIEDLLKWAKEKYHFN